MVRLGEHLKSCLHCSQHLILYKNVQEFSNIEKWNNLPPQHYFHSDPQKGSYFALHHANLYSSQDLFTTHFRKPVLTSAN